MASIVIEHLDPPATTRGARTLDDAGERAAEILGGRTVWCATGLAAARRTARDLRARVDGAGPGVATVPLPVTAEEPLRRLAERLDRMLAGVAPDAPDLGGAEANQYTEAARAGDALGGDAIGADDMVVVNDPLSALLAGAARERGAHTVWNLRGAPSPTAAGRQALDFVQQFAPGVDAYVVAWVEQDPRHGALERVAAAMPAVGVVAAMECPLGAGRDESDRLTWRTALAEVVRSDRGESVGGTRHPRPAVAAR